MNRFYLLFLLLLLSTFYSSAQTLAEDWKRTKKELNKIGELFKPKKSSSGNSDVGNSQPSSQSTKINQSKVVTKEDARQPKTKSFTEATPDISGWWHFSTSNKDLLELYLGENGIGKYDGEDMTYKISKNSLRIESKSFIHVFIVEQTANILKLSTGNEDHFSTMEFAKGKNPIANSNSLLPRTRNSKLAGPWYFKDSYLIKLVFDDNGRVQLEDRNEELRKNRIQNFLAFPTDLSVPFLEDGKVLKIGEKGRYNYSIVNDSILTLTYIGKDYIFVRLKKTALGDNPQKLIGQWFFPYQEDKKIPGLTPVKYQYDVCFDFLSNGRLIKQTTRKMDGEVISSEKGWWGSKNGKLSLLIEDAESIAMSNYSINANQLTLTSEYEGYSFSMIGSMVKKHSDILVTKPISESKIITENKTTITSAELCEYFPLKNEMVYSYEIKGESVGMGLLQMLSDRPVPEEYKKILLKEEYEYVEQKKSKGKNFKGYRVNSTDVNRRGKLFYYSCENGAIVSHTEQYEIVSNDEGLEYDWWDNSYTRKYSLEEKGTGQFVNWTLLKANTPINVQWVEEQITGSIIMVTKSVIEEMGITITVNGKQYKDVIKVKKLFSKKGGDSFGEQEIYFAKGVGIIKKVDISMASGEIFTELTSFSIQ